MKVAQTLIPANLIVIEGGQIHRAFDVILEQVHTGVGSPSKTWTQTMQGKDREPVVLQCCSIVAPIIPDHSQ